MTTTTKKDLDMHNPPHPGGVLLRLYLEPLGLTITETARAGLGISRKHQYQLAGAARGRSCAQHAGYY